MDDELPLGLPPLPPPLQALIEAGGRPGLRVGSRDGMVRRADRSVARRPELVKDADGPTEFQRRFLELVIAGDPETGEALKPAEAWLQAGGSAAAPSTMASRMLLEPAVLAAVRRGAVRFVHRRGLVGKVAELIDRAITAELREARAAGAGYQPSRVVQFYAAVVVALAGLGSAAKVDATADGPPELFDRLTAARSRARHHTENPVDPPEIEAENINGSTPTTAAY